MRRPDIELWVGCALALGGCAGGQGGNTSIGATTLPAMTVGAGTGEADDDDDEDDGFDDGFDDRGDDDDDDNDDNDDNDDRDDDDDDDESTGGDHGTGDDDDDDDDGGPTSSQMLHFNVEGAFLTTGMDNAPLWESAIITRSEDVAAYADTNRAGQIQTAFESIIADYPYEVVNEDPGVDGEYTMILLMDVSSSTFGFPSTVLSVAASDCGNENPNNIILVFDDESMSHTVDRVANAIAYSLGTASGLNPNSSAGDVMNATAAETASAFTDECRPVSDSVCPIIPAGLCNAGEQNSHEALEASFP